MTSSSPPVSIETDDVILRTVVDADITQRLAEWLDTSEAYKGLNIAPVNSDLERLRGFRKIFNNTDRLFIGIFPRARRKIIGSYTIDVNLQHKNGTRMDMLSFASFRNPPPGRGIWGTV